MTFHHDFLNVLTLPQAEAGYDHDSGAFVLFDSGRLLKTRQNITVFLVRTRRAIVMADSLLASFSLLPSQPSWAPNLVIYTLLWKLTLPTGQ